MEEYRCPKCGAAADERYDCCEVHALTRKPMDTLNMIFVFGSNEAGRHGAGAARFARMHKGAVWGQGFGRQGQSFGIPTKDWNLQSLALPTIRAYALSFQLYARNHRELDFQVTCLGCGLAGYRHEDIAPMFVDAPPNCYFDTEWHLWLGDDHPYWGTFTES